MASLLSLIGRCGEVGADLNLRPYLFPGTAWEEHSLRDRFSTHLRDGESVSDWLKRYPHVKASIKWEKMGQTHNSAVISHYESWPSADKDRLQELVNIYADCGSADFDNPPENILDLTDDQYAQTHISAADAKNLYFSYLAHILTVEMGNWVPWSITEFHVVSLENLLNSRNIIMKRSADNIYVISRYDHGAIIPALPRFTFEFMYKERLIGYTQLETILLLIDWVRINLGHAGGEDTIGRNESTWGYRGFPTVKAIIEDDFPQYPVRRPTSGCGCTTGFLRSLLMSVNIPVSFEQRCHHSMPNFLNEYLFLSHGDDITGEVARMSEIDSLDLLINGDTFHNWFDSPDADCANIGRGTDEALANLNG